MSHLTRALFLVTILFSIFVFFETRTVSTQHRSVKDFALAQLASAVGMTASVASNPDNTVAKELRLWQERLEQQEQAFVQLGTSGNSIQRLTNRLNVSFGIEIVLLLILGCNFFLDYKRAQYV